MLFKNLLAKILMLMVILKPFTRQNVVISGVTTDPYRQHNNLTGSINGGTTLYIDGSGFDDETYLNEVYVGDFQCNIDNYYTTTQQLVCDMPRMYYSVHKDLMVKVKVKGVTYACTQGDCYMNLETRYTPKLYSITPQATSAGEHITVCGVFRTDWVKDLKEVRVSGRNCILTEEQQEDATLSYWGYTCLDCQLADDLEVGDHTLTVTSARGTGFDNPMRQSQAFSVGHVSETYNLRIYPKVKKVNSNSGYLDGQLLELRGNNFGNDISKVSVSVGDVDCQVYEVEAEKIKCELRPRAAIPEENAFFRGNSGFRNIVYENYDRDFEKWWNNENNKTVRHDVSILSLENQLNEDQYAQKMFGIFKTQEAGKYTFKIAGDDQSRLLISKDPIDPSVPLTWELFDHDLNADGEPNETVNKCEIVGWTNFRDFFDEPTQVCSYTLQANSEYYLYVMQTEGGGGDHLSVNVTVPNSDTSKINTTPHAQKVSIRNTPVRQQWKIKIQGATGGNFRLRFTELNQETGEFNYNKSTSNIPHNATADYVAERIRRAIGTRSEAVRKPLNGNGNVIQNESLAEGYQWEITFESHRTRNVPPQFHEDTELIGANVSKSVEVTREQSDSISGTFVLKYGENSVTFNAHWGHTTMRDKLMEFPELTQGVTVGLNNNKYDGYEWTVYFDSISGMAKDLVIESHEIKGGNGNNVGVNIDTKHELPTTDLIYNPIPSEFLSQFSDKPQIVVKVNEKAVICDGSTCEFNYLTADSTPVVESFSRNGRTVSINLADGWDQHVSKNDLIPPVQTEPETPDPTTNPEENEENQENEENNDEEDSLEVPEEPFQVQTYIKFANSRCEVKTAELPLITCDLPLNADGSVYLEAGSHIPMVHLDKKGYFKVADGVTPEVVPLNITNVSPSSGSLGGGTVVTIEGSGFAVLNEFSDIGEITIDGQKCEVLLSKDGYELTNQKMQCLTQARNSSSRILEQFDASISLSVNGVTQTSDGFKYDTAATPYIVSLDKTSSSPVLKKDLVITGENFGTNTSKLSVIMRRVKETDDDPDVEYLCNVFEADDTELSCRLSGGKSGNYNLQVVKEGSGYSLPKTNGSNSFTYELIVDSVSPSVVSTEGGTVLTITGENFSEILLENQVVIGPNRSDYCIMISATPTELTCRLNKPKENLGADPVDLHVIGRAQEIANCKGTCKVQLDESITPSISGVGPNNNVKVAGNSVELTVSKMPSNVSTLTVELGGETIDNATLNADKTLITFSMPELPFGSYHPKVMVNNIGYAAFEGQVLMIESPLILSNVSPSIGTRYGQELTLTGNGFAEDIVIPKINDDECVVHSVTSTEIKCRAPKITKTDTVYSVSLYYESPEEAEQSVTCSENQTCSYQSQEQYPKLTSSSVIDDPDNAGQVLVLLEGSKLKDNGKSGDELVSYTDSTVRAFLTPVDSKSSFVQEGPVKFLASNIQMTLANPVAGKYMTHYFIPEMGYSSEGDEEGLIVEIAGSVTNVSQITSSLNGGSELTVTGTNFPQNEHKDLMEIQVCGVRCEMISSSSTEAKCSTPALNSESVQNNYNLESPQILRNASVTGDRTHRDMSLVLDGDINTYYYGHGNNDCFVQLDYGAGVIVGATKIRLFPRVKSNESNLIGGSLRGSLDGQNWEVLATVDNTVVENWNDYRPEIGTLWKFRYLMFDGAKRDCQIAEIEVTGYEFVNIPNFNPENQDCDVTVTFHGMESEAVQASKVNYSMDNTPVVESISPNRGTTVGGTTVTITGTNFGTDSVVLFDGIECVNNSAPTATQIVCTTGDRPTFTESTMEIKSNLKGSAVTRDHVFLYIDRWSNPATWGGETPPRSGDSVHVPVGQILLVDEAKIDIYAMIVEGTVIFEDMDMEFDAWFVYVNKGRLQIGTPENPIQNNITITMHGDRFSKTLPGFGNKGIFIQDGKLDIHGKPLKNTWTHLQSSLRAGDTKLTLPKADFDDWKVGDELLITPTSRIRDEDEVRVVKQINDLGTNLEFVFDALDFDHFSGVIDFDPSGVESPVELRGEVANLTRNLRIQGDPTTEITNHGCHILMRGKEGNSFGRISYIEERLAGQKFQLGRYPIHFHMIGHVHDQYVKGNSVHHTFNRGTTIHGVHYLTVEDNVYYKTLGHTIFLEDAIETNNVIQRNLVCHVNPSPSLLMSDMKPSGLWQARPTNHIRNNVFVACAGNGKWLEPAGRPTGPSKVDNICPVHDHMNQYDNNIHHTNTIGLRIYPVYLPREEPCKGLPNITLRDPWAGNPAQPAIIKDNLMYMNGLGSFGKHIGGVVYKDLTLISNSSNQKVAKPDAHDTITRVEGGISVGESDISAFHNAVTSTAINLGLKDGLLLNNVRFFHFNHGVMFRLCTGCRSEQKRVAGGVKTNWKTIRFENVTVPILQFSNALYDKDIQYDFDGSFIKQFGLEGDDAAKIGNEGGWITAYFKHLDNDHCVKLDNESKKVSNYPLIVCNKNIALLRLKHTVLDNANLMYGQDLKLFKLSPKKTGDVDFNFDMNTPDDESTPDVNENDVEFGIMKFRNLWLTERWRGWLSIVATSYEYNYHFGWGVEWKKIKMQNDYQWGSERRHPIDVEKFNVKIEEENFTLSMSEREKIGLPEFKLPELPTWIRHNHTEHRELFDNWFSGLDENDESQNELLSLSLANANDIKAQTTKFGDYYYDSANETINWKLDEKRIGSVISEAIYCRDHCPKEDVPTENDNLDPQMLWSDVAAWKTTNKVPEEGDEVVIEKQWNIKLDVPTPTLKSLKIMGRLEFDPDFAPTDDNPELVLNSKIIDIASTGELFIGSDETPYSSKAKIFLTGKKSDDDIVITPGIAPVNKAIVNKGKFKVVGQVPNSLNTRLVQKIEVGDTNFFIANGNHGWKEGDEVVVAATKNNNNRVELDKIDFKPEYEKVTIKEVVVGANSTEIKIDTATKPNGFEYFHYGAVDSLTTEFGVLDMRAEVAHLSRNVKVESDLTDSWGCTIITPMYLTESDPGYGWISFTGVEIQNCGQRDTKKAAIDINFARGSTQKIEKSSFNENQGWAFNINASSNVIFDNNVIFNARKNGIFIQDSNDVQITNNVVIGVKQRENYDNIEFWDIMTGIYYNDTTRLGERKVHIKNNIVSGSPWFGYVVPGYTAEDEVIETKDDVEGFPFFVNNTAHNNRGGWFAGNLTDDSLNKFSNFIGYKNWEQGFVNRQDAIQVEVSNFILSDNTNAIAINAAGTSSRQREDPYVNFSDSIVIGKALDDCAECYEGEDNCETSGIYSALFNGSIYDFYFEKERMPFHNSTSVNFSRHGTQKLENLTFKNFNKNDNCANQSFAIRMNNFYQDKTNAVYIKGITLENVDDPNKFYFANHKRHLDTPAYCGKRDCTGNYNTPFYDLDGSIFDKPMTFFGNNKGAGKDGECTFFEEWNGHACNPEYVQLYMQIPPNDAGIVFMPATLKRIDYEEDVSDDLKFEHRTDSPKSVTNLVRNRKHTYIEFDGTMHSGIIYSMRGDDLRDEDSNKKDDWVIIRVYSENPATMTVFVNGSKKGKKPSYKRDGSVPDMLDSRITSQCGANYYDHTTRTLDFIVHEDNCNVKVTFADSLQVNMVLDIPLENMTDAVVSTVVDAISATLGISIDRIRVVGVRRKNKSSSGRRVLQDSAGGDPSEIIFEIIEKEADGEIQTSQDESKEEFNNFKEILNKGIEDGSLDVGAPVLEVESVVNMDEVEEEINNAINNNNETNETTNNENTETPGTDDETKKSSKVPLIVGLCLGIPIVIALIVGVTWYILKKGKKSPQKYNNNSTNMTKEDTMNRDVEVNNFVVNNAGINTFGKHGNIKFAKKMALNDNNSKLESYIKRKS